MMSEELTSEQKSIIEQWLDSYSLLDVRVKLIASGMRVRSADAELVRVLRCHLDHCREHGHLAAHSDYWDAPLVHGFQPARAGRSEAKQVIPSPSADQSAGDGWG